MEIGKVIKMHDLLQRTIKEFEQKAKDYPNRAGAYKIAIDYLKARIAALPIQILPE